ncbi:MAG: carboxypeptidase-like regulatory domain-containing protein, partial [Bacteroidales bacterium]
MKFIVMRAATWVLAILFSIIASEWLNGQTLTQTIRGKIIDMDTKSPLIGATVIVLDTDPVIGTVTDPDGEFRLTDIPVRRQSIKVSYVGYNERVFNNLMVVSAKELVLNVELEEKILEVDEVVVKAWSRKDRPINDMATVSARSFTIEETERFAGSLGDPARLVANYAGVVYAGDSRNDIVIRGNSPMGLLWRLDGVEIPNPNHFAALGTTGGAISMVNNNLLTNSDFFTGAFPAEYGNATAGVFDLKLRSGNNENREYVFQVGLNGFELGAEGPFSKNAKNSYLINYRYSTYGLLHAIGIET